MNPNQGNLTILHIAMLIITAVGLINHVIIIPVLLNVAGRDAWVSVLLIVIPYLLWIGLLLSIVKRTKQKPIIRWLQDHYGRMVARIASVMFAGQFLLLALVTLKDLADWTHASYLPKTPVLLISLVFWLLCILAAMTGIRSLAIVNGILLPFVVLLGFFVASSNLPNKDYSLLFPVFENGIVPVMNGMLYAGAGLFEIVILLNLQHRSKSPIRFRSIALTALFLLYMTFGPITGAIAEFGPTEAARQRYPAFEEWRLVTIGHYVEHVDFLVIYQWMSGAFVRISLYLFLVLEILAVRPTRTKGSWILLLSLTALMLFAMYGVGSDIQFLRLLNEGILPFSFAYYITISLVLFALVRLRTSRKGDVK
ncbi:endospore germination permease [Brevibacillus humidisoli]|uniref:GerAB/ArcD/ProY family transporter n=1 Tax=Brevibacillus humidisoli TaxID=2895522 RepID=UPI001E4AC99C|nr:endospore germination permease [Brevibacillus humidisoli]UFJ42625.1 endospore germination permease [Brevibacillus humidisoli]